MFGSAKSPEEREERAQVKAAEKARRDAERERAAFRDSPAGQAREVYERGDQLYQVTLDIEDVSSHVVAMANAYTARRARDVSDVLNAIAGEGWEFRTLSTTFVNEGQESRDRFLASGQHTAVRGRVLGTYVFARR